MGNAYSPQGGKETTFPYSPEQELTVVAKCSIQDGQITQVGFLPCLAGQNNAPEILKNDEKGKQVFEYMENITKGAELNARYEWEGDEVMLYT